MIVTCVTEILRLPNGATSLMPLSETACPIVQAVSFLLAEIGDRPLVLAFSGGMDSTVLLHALSQQRRTIKAVHIHHGLQAVAEDWVRHCQQQARLYGVALHIERVIVSEASRRGMEDKARTARYEALWQQVPKQGVLITAHHQRDQAETLLMRVMRGTGLQGLGAIRAQQAYTEQRQLMRPLLGVSYQQLQHYAEQHQLHWVEDPTNATSIALRNHVRHTLLPLMTNYQPAIELKLAQLATHAQEANQLLAMMAESDWQTLTLGRYQWHLSRWQSMPWLRAKQALLCFAQSLGISWTAVQWQQIEQQFYIKAHHVTHPRLVAHGYCLMADKGVGYCVPKGWLCMPERRVWSLCDVSSIAWGEWARLTVMQKVACTIEVRARVGGERIQTSSKSQSLKKWLQQQSIPAWQMALWPVFWDVKTGQCVGWAGLSVHSESPMPSIQLSLLDS